jgi:hypothetical protein
MTEGKRLSMPQTNPLLRMIEADTVPLGMQCFTANHALIEVLGATGFDFDFDFDFVTEDSPANPRAIEDAIRAADGVGLVPLVRVPSAADEPTNIQSREGFFWRATLWATSECPPDNSIEGDRSEGIATREPPPGGLISRALEIRPDTADTSEHRRVLGDLNRAVQQKHDPSEADLTRCGSVPRTFLVPKC